MRSSEDKVKYLERHNHKIKSIKQFNYQAMTLFDSDINNKTILDIGCGDGRFSLWAAINGAKKVVCLEPEASGSTKKTTRLLRETIKDLGLTIINFVSNTLQEYYDKKYKFDIVVMKNSINHLDEQNCIILHKNKEARDTYQHLFDKIGTMMNNKGKIIITDCTKFNFFQLIGMKNIFSPSIEWNKHQTPELWTTLLNKSGFIKPRISWSVPYPIRFLKPFLDNKIMSYFLISHFRLEMSFKNN